MRLARKGFVGGRKKEEEKRRKEKGDYQFSINNVSMMNAGCWWKSELNIQY
jgi:hypothetical protein